MERWMVHSTHSFISISNALTASKLILFVLLFVWLLLVFRHLIYMY
jgi:hypothetical protein